MEIENTFTNIKVAIIGLGYVGLPLAVALAAKREVIGFDISQSKVDLINKRIDPNSELNANAFDNIALKATSEIKDIADCNFYIVGVPTPITKNKVPDLGPLKSATKSIGHVLKKGDLVVYESTVFPGCTEEVCVPILEKVSGLTYLKDFKVGYSPERINPGDKVHTLTNTIKIVSGCDQSTLEVVAKLYEEVVEAGVFRAKTIKVAEAAKIIENVQRDVNIALMNELSLIFDKMDVNTLDVIEAAATKWNFMKFYPGLVGGHCISVDPYYLTYKAIELGYYPEVILSGRKVNDKVSSNVSKKVVKHISRQGTKLSEASVLVMGVSFKENVSDFRNSKVIDLIKELESYEINVDVEDPFVDHDEIKKKEGIKLCSIRKSNYQVVILAVVHEQYKAMTEQDFKLLGDDSLLLIDIKGMLSNKIKHINHWTL